MGVAALARRAARREGANDPDALRREARGWCDRLEQTRPTAVNLAWALRRMRRAATEADGSPSDVALRLREEADAIREEDREMCRRIGEHAVELLRDGSKVVTHCNAGALATGGIGTALAPLYVAHERGLRVRVFADETRPLLQGSRLTAWELDRAGVDVTVVSDGMAGALMDREAPDLVFVGADRIAANGDVANKIGTYGLAVLARHHGVPFYVLAPTSTVDLELASGEEIPIEHRSAEEIRRGFGTLTAPEDVPAWSPAFDVTPAALVDGIVTEQGVARPPYERSLRDAVRSAEPERGG
jgi:methylthioribose-1-phosphate isomerase